ncbi:tetratricopeptide repeat protein [Kitasatospora sp. NPDC056184]|uniref:AfsR/SARP family transcriptional regulator n=1 Tax=Kitasatospora sp. NPDC056184 TaxID=3345738 RepID=UPI0035DA167D
MDGRVLGVVSVGPSLSSDGPAVMGVTKQAALFALLVTSPGGRCPLDGVLDCLWPGVESSRGRLDQVMKLLRKSLGKESLRTESGICSIYLPRDRIDLYRFRDQVQRAERLFGKDKVDALAAAMREWGGLVPLSGLKGEWVSLRRAELRRERRSVLESQLEAAQRAGMEDWLRTEADRWYCSLPEEDWPLRYYLIAHGTSLTRVRLKRLIKEWRSRFGRPDEGLQAVIDELDGKAPRSAATTLSSVPSQLPPPGRLALGRGRVIREVVAAVLRQQESGRPTVAVISGMPGIGKSLVVNRVAHRLREAFPDGVLYAELGGFPGEGGQPADPERVVDKFLAEFSLPYSPVGLEQKSAALRSVLAGRSVLMVLDDAWDDEQVLPLLPGTGPSAVLITSRRRPEMLRARQEVKLWVLDELDDESASELLQEDISPSDRRMFTQEVADLVEVCGGNPLALTVAARRLEGRPARAIRHLREQLAKEEGRLDALEHPPARLSVRAALACSVNALSEEARCLLWQLAVHPGPSIGWDAVMDLGSVTEGANPDRAVEELRAAHLVELQSGRYRLHNLVRTFARQQVRPPALTASPGFEEATVWQILEHQLHYVWACDRWLDGQRWLPVGEPEGITVVQPEDRERALALLDDEYEAALRGVELSRERESRRHMWLLPMALVTYQWRRHLFEDAQRGLTWASEAAELSGVPAVDQAMIFRMLAGTRWHQDSFEIAAGHLSRAVRLSERDSSPSGRLSLARSLHTLALTRRKQGQEAAAEQCHRSALELYRELADDAGTAAALNGLGTLYHDRGQHDEALRLCTEALDLVSRTADRSGWADVLRTLAGIRFALGEREPSLVLFQQAADIYRDLGSWTDEDRALCLYTDALVALGRTAEAVSALERVLVLRELMGGKGIGDARDRLESLR